MDPLRAGRQDHRIEVLENRLKGLWRERRSFRQSALHRTGRDVRYDGKLAPVALLAVVRYPIDQFVSEPSEFIDVHAGGVSWRKLSTSKRRASADTVPTRSLINDVCCGQILGSDSQ